MNVSGRLAKQQENFRRVETAASSMPRDMSRTNKKYKEQKTVPVMYYFNSPVQNSHEYPNMQLIRPYGLDYRPSSIGKISLDKFKKEEVVVGRRVFTTMTAPKLPRLWE